MTRTRFVTPRRAMERILQGEDLPDQAYANWMAINGGPSNYVADHKIYLHDDLLKLGPDDLRGCILHEMVHITMARRWGRRGGHHGKRFAAECNRIGVPLGWGRVYADPHGFLEEYEDCIYWPMMQDEVAS